MPSVRTGSTYVPRKAEPKMTYPLRLPESIYWQVKDLAAELGYSMSATVVGLLDRGLRSYHLSKAYREQQALRAKAQAVAEHLPDVSRQESTITAAPPRDDFEV